MLVHEILQAGGSSAAHAAADRLNCWLERETASYLFKIMLEVF